MGNVFIVGDWNSRVSIKRDYTACDKYLDCVDCANYIPSVRNTVDTVSNLHGQKKLHLCKATL